MKIKRILGERVFIKEDERKKEFVKGLIEVPYDYQRKSSSGEILQLGDPVVAETYGIRVGDTAYLHRYAGASLLSDDQEESEYRFVNPNQVLAVVRDGVVLVRGDRALVEDIEAPKQKGSIILPDQHAEDHKKGRVVSTGDKTSSELVSGDVVMYEGKSGVITEIADKKYRILDTDAIIGIVEE